MRLDRDREVAVGVADADSRVAAAFADREDRRQLRGAAGRGGERAGALGNADAVQLKSPKQPVLGAANPVNSQNPLSAGHLLGSLCAFISASYRHSYELARQSS